MRTNHFKILIIVISVLLSFGLVRSSLFQNFVVSLDSFGYLGAFISGVFWVFTYTIAPATSSLLLLGSQYNPLLVSLIAGLGAIFGDLIVFRFVEDSFHEEMKSLYLKKGGKHLNKFFKRFLNGLLPILGALIIMSPLPDEWGVALMGVSEINTVKFTLLSLILNIVGIYGLITLGRILIN